MINIIKSLDAQDYKCEVLLIKDSIVAEKLNDLGIPYNIVKSTFYSKYYHYFTHSEAGYIKWYQIFRFTKLSMYWLLSRYYFAKKELDKFEYDIVHLNSSVLTDWLAPCKRKGKVIINIQEPVSMGYFGIRHSFFKNQMKKYADKVIMDCTHSIQKPNSGKNTNGNPEMIETIALSATAAGIDGLFFEVYPNPQKALSDALSMLPLNKLESILKKCIKIKKIII